MGALAMTHLPAGGATEVQGFEEFWQIFPRPRHRRKSSEYFASAVALGVDASIIVRAALRYRAECVGVRQMYRAGSDIWLEARRWEQYPDCTEIRGRTMAVKVAALFWADKLKAQRFIPQRAISNEIAACIIFNGLANEQDFRRAGLDP